MADAPAIVSENRQDWFWMLVCYMKMKTWSHWLRYYPDTSYESFDLLWPLLFDHMLTHATTAAVAALAAKSPPSVN
jgi:hypothetical protein